MKVKMVYSVHVVIQMFKRGLSEDDIVQILNTGVIIREYPEDKPYPSFLILGFRDRTPLHIVYAVNEVGKI